MITNISVAGTIKVELNEINQEKIKQEIEKQLPILLGEHLKILSGKLNIIIKSDSFEVAQSIGLGESQKHDQIYIETNKGKIQDVLHELW